MKPKPINSINDLKKFFIKELANFYPTYSDDGDNEALLDFYRNYPLGEGTLLELRNRAEIDGKDGFFADLVDGKFQEASPRYSYSLSIKLTEEEFKNVFGDIKWYNNVMDKD